MEKVEKAGAPGASLAYGALLIWGVLWPQFDIGETLFALRSAAFVEANPHFSTIFHVAPGLYAGLLLHVGLSLAVLAFAMATHTARDARLRAIGVAFLLGFAALGIAIVGHNGVLLLKLAA